VKRAQIPKLQENLCAAAVQAEKIRRAAARRMKEAADPFRARYSAPGTNPWSKGICILYIGLNVLYQFADRFDIVNFLIGDFDFELILD
jgi:hypothetical protein